VQIIFKKDDHLVSESIRSSVKVAASVLHHVLSGKGGELVATSMFNSPDQETANYLKGHFQGRKNRYCSSWMYENGDLYLIDKIYCSPAPLMAERVPMDWSRDLNGVPRYLERNYYRKDDFPTDQDVYRITGLDWCIILKSEGGAMYNSDGLYLGRGFPEVFDVEIFGNQEELVDAMLMFKLLGFEQN
jgi:hypothetical protein